MKSDFLIQDEIKVQRFTSIKIEKSVSDVMIMITISALPDFTTIRVNEEERLLQIIQRPYVGDFNLPDARVSEDISFIIPACFEIQSCYIKKEKQKTYVIFNRAGNKMGGAYYFY